MIHAIIFFTPSRKKNSRIWIYISHLKKKRKKKKKREDKWFSQSWCNCPRQEVARFFSSLVPFSKKMIFEHSISRTIPCIYLPLLFYTMARLTNHKPFPTMLSFLRRSVCTAMHICIIWFLFGIKKKKKWKK